MELDNKQICRLCLDIISPGDAEVIGEKKKETLEVLLINVDLRITDNAVACSRCMEEVLSGFEFKSACFRVANCISMYGNAKVPVDLKKIFQAEMPGTAMVNVNLENRQICRLCMSLIEGEALDCNTNLKDIIANCLPDVDIHTVHEPLVCELCFSRMKKLNQFMNTCQEIEQRINNYYLQAGMDHAIPVAVNLNDLLKFKDYTISGPIKEERSNFAGNLLMDPKREDTANIECEEIHIKDELDSVDEMGDSVQSGACNNSGNNSSLKRKRKIGQCTAKGRKHFSADGHMARHRGLAKMFACQDCVFKTDWKHSLAQHMIRHRVKSEVEMLKCYNCEFETRYKSSIIKHMLKHRDPKAERKFKCDKCPYETDIKFCLSRHNLRHTDKSEMEMLKCDNCEYETMYKSTLMKHMVKHQNPKAERNFKCDKSLYEANFEDHPLKHNLTHKNIRKCENFEFETAFKYKMISHMPKHRNPKATRKFKCDKCTYETNFKGKLRRHNLRHGVKSEMEILKCENCEYETMYKSRMVKHMQWRHRNPRAEIKFKCDKCPFQTDFIFSIRRHSLKHRDKSEVEMHKCEKCDYETRQKSSLNRHMLQHRDPNAEKKYKCDKCLYETNYKSNLSVHNLIHKEKSEVEMHRCEDCAYETRQKGSLNRHMLKHRHPRAEKKFKCDKCPFQTDSMISLCRHSLKHKDKA